MGQWTAAAKVGLFVLVIGVASFFIYRFVSRTAGTEGGYTVFAELKDATGLAPQSRVMMAGISSVPSARFASTGAWPGSTSP